jgi:purine-binding chemotaxis protein CheW
MQIENFGQQVVHQEMALDSYLSTLLDEIPTIEELDQAEEIKLKTVEKTVKQVKSPAIKPKPIKKIAVQTIKKEEKTEQVIKPLSVMPSWTQNEFQALFFRVDKMILATPLTELLRTIKIEKAPTTIPGQPSWFMGLLDTHEQRIGVLDTGQLIFGKSIGLQIDREKQPFQSILITGDGKWGLACDEVLSIGTLEPEKVRWRTLRDKKTWLVGTVIDELTAIIDVNHLVPHRKSS